jgi:hypothetical protein
MLTFGELKRVNKARCLKFHPIDEWRPSQWSNAMAGECGEACNLTKKMDRIAPDSRVKIQMNKVGETDMFDLIQMLSLELGDVIIYADLLATRVGLNLEDCVRDAFNNKSKSLGMSERV